MLRAAELLQLANQISSRPARVLSGPPAHASLVSTTTWSFSPTAATRRLLGVQVAIFGVFRRSHRRARRCRPRPRARGARRTPTNQRRSSRHRAERRRRPPSFPSPHSRWRSLGQASNAFGSMRVKSRSACAASNASRLACAMAGAQLLRAHRDNDAPGTRTCRCSSNDRPRR